MQEGLYMPPEHDEPRGRLSGQFASILGLCDASWEIGLGFKVDGVAGVTLCEKKC